ncbi:phage head closure protein [Rhizobium sp. BR 250]
MRSGKLDRSITIQSFANTVNDYGTPVATWTDVGTIRAQLIQSSTEEFLTGGASDETVVIFRTRFLPGVTGASRVLYQGREFNIREVKEIGRRVGLELRCERTVTT